MGGFASKELLTVQNSLIQLRNIVANFVDRNRVRDYARSRLEVTSKETRPG